MKRHHGLCCLLVAFMSPLSGQDTVRVSSNNAPVWGDVPRLVEELRIGSIDGPSEYVFGRVAGIAVTGSGAIWVGDLQAGVIRRYSSVGEHLGDVGRKGEGPGEFSEIHGLRLLPDGTLAVWDPLNARIHFFDEAGQFLKAVRTPMATLVALSGFPPLDVDTSGVLSVLSLSFPAEPGEGSTAFWVRFGPDGAVLDTLVHPPSNRAGVVDATMTRPMLSPLGFVAVGRNNDYALSRPLGDGRIMRIDRAYEEVEYTRSERREKQVLEEHFAERNGRDARRVPREKPVWKSVLVDLDGRYWVQRYVPGVRIQETAEYRETRLRFGNPERTWAEPLVFDVIEANGRFMGTVRFPGEVAQQSTRPELQVARGNHLWVIERGAFGEEYIVRYRVERGG